MTTATTVNPRNAGVHTDSSQHLDPAHVANSPSAHTALTAGQRFARYGVLVAPLVLVNAAAIFGQVQWAASHLTSGNYALAALFALTLESIAVYLAYEAHSALLAGDASLRLRAASYLAAGIVGALNYSHFAAPDLRPTTAAIAFGMLSTISPWLWSIRSRSLRRDQLRAAGLIDPRSAHFGAAKWLNFPIRTMRAYRWSVDHGVQQERTAWEQSRRARQVAGGTPDPTPGRPLDSQFVHVNSTDEQTMHTTADLGHTESDAVTTTAVNAAHAAELAKLPAAADAVRYAFDALGHDDVPTALRWLRQHGRDDVHRGNAYRVRRQVQQRRKSVVALATS